MTAHDPCYTCKSDDVHIRRVHVSGSESAADPRPDFMDLRVCNNPKCPTNTGDRSLADRV